MARTLRRMSPIDPSLLSLAYSAGYFPTSVSICQNLVLSVYGLSFLLTQVTKNETSRTRSIAGRRHRHNWELPTRQQDVYPEREQSVLPRIPDGRPLSFPPEETLQVEGYERLPAAAGSTVDSVPLQARVGVAGTGL